MNSTGAAEDKYGVGDFRTLEDFRLDIETCFGASCSFCERGCPVYQVTKEKTYTSKGRNRTLMGILLGKYEPDERMADVYYSCTLCGNCARWCALPDLEMEMSFRRYLIAKGQENPKLKRIKDNMLETGNPYGKPASEKLAWQNDYDFNPSSHTMFFGGCTMPLKDKETLEKYIELLDPNNLTVMEGEVCCGSTVHRVGYEDAHVHQATQIIDYVKDHGITEIFTACPGCYSTLKGDMEKAGINVKVRHAVEGIKERIEKGEIELEKQDIRVTYHDPCHLGRLGGVIEEPRFVIQNTANLVEMRDHGMDSLCCGAGGGVRAAFPDLSHDVARRRLEQAEETGAELIVSACPFCENQLREAGEKKVGDVVDLVYAAWKKKK